MAKKEYSFVLDEALIARISAMDMQQNDYVGAVIEAAVDRDEKHYPPDDPVALRDGSPEENSPEQSDADFVAEIEFDVFRMQDNQSWVLRIIAEFRSEGCNRFSSDVSRNGCLVVEGWLPPLMVVPALVPDGLANNSPGDAIPVDKHGNPIKRAD